MPERELVVRLKRTRILTPILFIRIVEQALVALTMFDIEPLWARREFFHCLPAIKKKLSNRKAGLGKLTCHRQLNFQGFNSTYLSNKNIRRMANIFIVGEEGVEPSRPCGHWNLNPACIPFHHSPLPNIPVHHSNKTQNPVAHKKQNQSKESVSNQGEVSQTQDVACQAWETFLDLYQKLGTDQNDSASAETYPR